MDYLDTESFALLFPRSKERGPIEARGLADEPVLGPVNFRARKSAAPLKHLTHESQRLHHRDFRARKSAAPLKPRAAASPRERVAVFPRSKERGPIEARPTTPRRTS